MRNDKFRLWSIATFDRKDGGSRVWIIFSKYILLATSVPVVGSKKPNLMRARYRAGAAIQRGGGVLTTSY